MEEIWKDIPNLSSIQNPNNSFDAMKLQDFLARPFLYPNYNLNLNPVFPSTPAEINLFPAVHASPVCSNNGVLLRPQGNSLSSHHPVSSMTSTQQHLGLGMQSGGSARKRTAVPFENYDQNNGSSCSDRRYQRLIKNRESAARSRDRKEAHTAQLVGELDSLRAENARLKKQQQLRESAAAQALKNHPLSRSSSSPL